MLYDRKAEGHIFHFQPHIASWFILGGGGGRQPKASLLRT